MCETVEPPLAPWVEAVRSDLVAMECVRDDDGIKSGREP